MKTINARLISAAPALLEACQIALHDTLMLLNEECEFSPENLQTTAATLQEAIDLATQNTGLISKNDSRQDISFIKQCPNCGRKRNKNFTPQKGQTHIYCECGEEFQLSNY